MDTDCLNHRLTEPERLAFERDGFIMVPDAIPPDLVSRVEAVMDRLDKEFRPIKEKGPHEALGIHDFIGKDPIFLELLDCPKTILRVCEILGWNIKLYHSDYRYTPPRAPEERGPQKRLGWHQDSGRLNRELEGSPRPRVSLKVAFFISDLSSPGRGNFHVVPGSHLLNSLESPDQDPDGKTPVLAAPGTAAIFDRRLFHSASPNDSEQTRKSSSTVTAIVGCNPATT